MYGKRKRESSFLLISFSFIHLSHPSIHSCTSRKHRQDSLKSLLSNGSGTANNSSNKDVPITTTLENSSKSTSATNSQRKDHHSTTTTSLNPSQCFSILFRGDWTLDLMMLSEKRDELLDALDRILQTYQEQKRKVSNDVLLLRYHWLDAVSDKVRKIKRVQSSCRNQKCSSS